MKIRDLKSVGKRAFKANYWPCVGVALIMELLLGYTASSGKSTLDQGYANSQQELTDTMNQLSSAELLVFAGIVFGTISVVMVISILLKIFLFNPLEVGGYRFFKKNIQEDGARFGVIGEGFSGYGHTFLTLFLRDLFICLWCILFLIPGIVKSYSYRLVPFIIKDNPELSATEAITRSRQLMNGNKWRAFVLDLSFIGWAILSVITCGIVQIFWAGPYYQSTNAALYLDILNQEQVS